MKLLLISLTAIFLSGCATILNEDMQKVTISSTKESLKGSIDGIPFEGPGIVSVKRAKGDRVVRINTEGCQKELLLASTVDPKFFINILLGGSFGSTTDYSTEKMWKYQDNLTVPCN